MAVNRVFRWLLVPVVAMLGFRFIYPAVLLFYRFTAGLTTLGPQTPLWWVLIAANFMTGYGGVFVASEVAPAHQRVTGLVAAAMYITVIVTVAVVGPGA
jgi:drug/metabolite transporter (DMT)-like permease